MADPKAYLGGNETFDYNLYRKHGRQSLAEQQGAALAGAGRATGGELVGLPGYAAGGVGPGYLMRQRQRLLRGGARQIGSDFSSLGAQQAGREQDFLGQLLQRRLEERYRREEEERNKPGFLEQALGVAGSVVPLLRAPAAVAGATRR